MKEINKRSNSAKARMRFQLGHTCGVTVFKVLKQEGIKKGCGEIFRGNNGWCVKSGGYPIICKTYKEICIIGSIADMNDIIHSEKDPNKETYNSILEIFKELGSLRNIPPKEGDTVLVRDKDEDGWSERIYITTLPNYCLFKYITLMRGDNRYYKKCEHITHSEWRQMKLIQENTFKEIRESIPDKDLGTVFEVEFCLEDLDNNKGETNE